MLLNTIRILFFGTIVWGVLFLPVPSNVDLIHNNLPFFSEGYLFGTDRLGRNNLALFCYGSLSTILIVIPARIFTIIFSFLISTVSLIFPKRSDFFLSGFVSVSLSIPSLLSALIVISILPESPFSLLVAILVSDWAIVYETLTAKIREIQTSPYIAASLCFGAKPYQLIWLHYLLALKSMFQFLFFSGLPTVVMTTALFSYLGIQTSVGETGPGLGEQISFSKDYFDQSPFSVLLPIIAILTLVYSLGSRNQKYET
ncbi:Permease component of an ABC transporter complex [Leptospira biflexa serovar Patoc strain 'Patoc 1 (Ames)']|uniref:ABC-type transport system, binding-protein-dependent transport system, inner membrane component n=1 Tax=Leptospira biflexa serovar Patoc (strain Patoc 1 / ATCC 23582 / Paris) TaxID=456481 RepID=B0SNE0_LEPBP|nr:ABC transporter permease subunit [Leptospira biflexa]ABZ95218.1 Permease component of an ABC transporter complex [Leptospira biflexa serovar Patoc strain 'Patoc 1 (Ames)']ABZ98907.1 ABC-type transport system, binding-protein-dependent transport system, inner membrane component [Leptospira biflexa serovar Patoc strain 'Patoc 1 (Paris)']